MKSIAELLDEKNQYLEKFYRLNEAEIEKFTSGEFNNLESFYGSREGILALIKKVDEMIEDSSEAANINESVTDDVKKIIFNCLKHKNKLVEKILEQDLRILSAIENEKSNIIKELSQVRTTKKALSSYKSGGPKSRLDEEA